MKRVSSFSQARQKEAARRYYANGTRPESIELPQQPVAAKQPVEQEA
jgi:hypothetical protein